MSVASCGGRQCGFHGCRASARTYAFMKPLCQLKDSALGVTRFMLGLLHGDSPLRYGGIARVRAADTNPLCTGVTGERARSLSTQGEFSDIAISIGLLVSALPGCRCSLCLTSIVPLDQPRDTACGPHGPSGALYCSLDSYLSPIFLSAQDGAVGDYAAITILAHEWGHHVQELTNAPNPGGSTFRLQADCLSGVYTLSAEEQGYSIPETLPKP